MSIFKYNSSSHTASLPAQPIPIAGVRLASLLIVFADNLLDQCRIARAQSAGWANARYSDTGLVSFVKGPIEDTVGHSYVKWPVLEQQTANGVFVLWASRP
ncbi:MAG: hypothetical protein JXA14_03705, partial [Anaerolineae bacterium]|nr:hypothetical protein [Anaerolineae bacterium]